MARLQPQGQCVTPSQRQISVKELLILAQTILTLIAAFSLPLVSSRDVPSPYHSTAEIIEILSAWEQESGLLTMLPTKSVHAIDLTDSIPRPKSRVFLICGEHPRELIGVETCLELVGQIMADAETVLRKNDIRIVVNANPTARKKAETGQFCLRTNGNGVDLNRNWDSHWKGNDCEKTPDQCAGSHPMSEAEVKEIGKLMLDFAPDLVISVHSGTYQILTPFAYSEEPLTSAIKYMISLLEDLSADTSQCPVGQGFQLLGYMAPGNIIDFAYLNTDALVICCFEIYEGENMHSFLKREKGEDEESACFQYFNPIDEEGYRYTVETWTAAVRKLIEVVANKVVD